MAKYDLVVFDLDFTLWNAGGTWCDHTYPPYVRHNGYILDAHNSRIFLYDESGKILEDLHQRNIKLAIASRTREPQIAKELMRLFEIEHYFTWLQIFPGSKTEHFRQLKIQTRIPFDQIIFFDDEHRNVSEVRRLGVKCVWVENGITRELVNQHLF